MKGNILYQALREKHPEFIYHSYEIRKTSEALHFEWKFEMPPGIIFTPRLEVPYSHPNNLITDDVLDNLVFNIGMVEMISYWKSACSPSIFIKPKKLSESAVLFWRNLFYLGLGEFRYINGIDVNEEDFLHIFSAGPISKLTPFDADPQKIIVPVGGGKDSAVSLSILHEAGKQIIPFMVNPLKASLRCIEATGIPLSDALIFKRTIDSHLLTLNSQNYLNGHTPFSALIAFNTLLASALKGAASIALSNESSANEVSIPGTEINHQYSKSIDFELNFREYAREQMGIDSSYFSFLRPLSELQIACLFSKRKVYHKVFRSCNVGSKTDVWCGHCPKCLFTSIILSPFISPQENIAIFGKDIFSDLGLQNTLDELAGWANVKPFECVGTIDEVRLSLQKTIQLYPPESFPVLLQYAKSTARDYSENDFDQALRSLNEQHFLDSELFDLLRKALIHCIDG